MATSLESNSGGMRQVHHHHQQQHPQSGTVAFVERKAELSSGVVGSTVGGSPGDEDGTGLNLPAAAADGAYAGLAFSIHSLPDVTPCTWTETETGRVAGDDDDDERSPCQHQNIGAFSALSHQMQQQQQTVQDLEQATVTLLPSMESVQLPVRTEQEGRTNSVIAAAVRDDDTVPMVVGGEGGDKNLNDQDRPELSSSGARSKMALEQDHGQAVRLRRFVVLTPPREGTVAGNQRKLINLLMGQ